MPRRAALLAVIALSAAHALAQTAARPQKGLPDPYEAPIAHWGTLPGGRMWGSTAGIEIGPRAEIWAIERCGANSCDDSPLPSVHRLDLATGNRSVRVRLEDASHFASPSAAPGCVFVPTRTTVTAVCIPGVS